MPFIPHTEADVRDMLAAIGAPDIEALFDEIPDALKVQSQAKVPEGLSEMDVVRLMRDRARQDEASLNFAGAGAYEHHIPSAVWARMNVSWMWARATPSGGLASGSGAGSTRADQPESAGSAKPGSADRAGLHRLAVIAPMRAGPIGTPDRKAPSIPAPVVVELRWPAAASVCFSAPKTRPRTRPGSRKRTSALAGWTLTSTSSGSTASAVMDMSRPWE